MSKIDWSRPTCVAFDPDCSVLELEMAYQIYNTLQSATGRKLRLCSTKDIPEDYNRKGNIILIGGPFADSRPSLPDKGRVQVIRLEDGRTRVFFRGKTPEQFEAAATDFTLRYWKNAKDSAIRVTGMERGVALGNPVALGGVNMP